MRPRTEVLVALGVFVMAILLAIAAGSERGAGLSTDQRTSSLSSGPNGTMALAEIIERAGGTVTRWRSRLTQLDSAQLDGALLAVINPPQALSENELDAVLTAHERGASVLLAGPQTGPLTSCLGMSFDFAILDSARVLGPSGRTRQGVLTTLEADTASRVRRNILGESYECPGLAIASIDTLLRSERGQSAMLRVRVAGSDASFLLVSDAGLLGTTAMRGEELPEVIVQAILGTSTRVIFDEYHHVGAQGSMMGATLAWTRRSPWGWAIWQLTLVGFLAFLTGAVRFGPVRAGIPRERRSPLEHVRALATALAASNGHDVAIGALVRGLQRRLAASGAEARRGARLARGEWLAFVERLAQRSPDPKARERAAHLAAFARPGQPDTAVREAANAVEDVWEALHR